MKNTLRSLSVLGLALMMTACGQKKEESDFNEEEVLAMSSNLQNVESGFVPESISETGAAVASKASSNDICDGVDFIQCQPRLIRAYIAMGKGSVGLARLIVGDLSRQLAGVKNGTSGTIVDEAKNVSIVYAKRSTVDFDFLVLKANTPIGRISANPQLYTIQFDLNELDKDKPGSRGGLIEIKLAYKDALNWDSDLTVTGQKCNTERPDDPESGRIHIQRAGGLWKGQSMFYSGTSATFGVQKTCDTQPSDNTSLVTYTDLVADAKAAKASLYLFKRNEHNISQLQNFSLSNFCSNYPDYCQGIASSLNLSSGTVQQTLSVLTNPYCVRQGSNNVTFNSNCAEVSQTVAEETFLENSLWMAPAQFASLRVLIPNQF